MAYKKGDWSRLSELARNGGYQEEQIPECFVTASRRAAVVAA
jgi:hypothetical protein